MPAEATALVFEDERWTWGELDRRSLQWAAHLVSAGVGPDDFVAFALPNGPELIALTFGIYRSGAIPAPLSPKLVDREMAEIVELLRRGRDWLEHPGSSGRSQDGFRLSIRDPLGREVDPGKGGEIFAIPPRGPGSSYRYLGAERRATPDGWESVGDVGHLDAEGYLYLADRRTDLITSAGINVWPAEVEGAILEHPAIRSCAVLGLPDDDLGHRVHAVIESDDASLDAAALRAFLASRLAPQKIPRTMTRTTEAVRDDAGKVRKSDWREMLRGAEHVH